MSNSYSCPPSQIYGIAHPVESFFFDKAVWYFGSTMDADLEESTKRIKKNREAAIERRLAKWMDDDDSGVGRFAAPAITTRGGKNG